MREGMSGARVVRGTESLRRRIVELESENKAFDGILNDLRVGVAVIDSSGRMTRSNRFWREHVSNGAAARDSIQMKHWDAFDEQGRPLPTSDWPASQALQGRSVSGVRFLHRTTDGREVWMRMNAAPLRMIGGRVVEAVCTVQEMDTLMQTEAALRRSQELLTDELLAARQLQETSEQTTIHGDFEPLIERILDAAVVIMRSDFASIQALNDKGDLIVLGLRGFAVEAAGFGEVVTLSSQTTCGEALRTGQRAIAADIECTDYMVDSEDLQRFRSAGIRACQATPLRTRSGRVVGMLSTHWHEPHQPAAYDLASLDVLARQAADLIDHWQGEEKQHRLSLDLEDERKLVLRLSAPILRIKEHLLLLPLIGVIENERADAIADALLEAVRRERAAVVVIDSSAMASIDRRVGEWLQRTVKAVQFLGAEVVLAGVPGRLAQSLLPIATELDGITIAGDLQEGLEMAMLRVD